MSRERWDEECEEKKREVRVELRRWRKDGEDKEGYREREMCERKKREENDRWEKEMEQVRRERDVWEIVNGGEGVERGFTERGRAQSGERK